MARVALVRPPGIVIGIAISIGIVIGIGIGIGHTGASTSARSPPSPRPTPSPSCSTPPAGPAPPPLQSWKRRSVFHLKIKTLIEQVWQIKPAKLMDKTHLTKLR